MAQDTRDRLLNAARDLSWRKGYHVASVAEILFPSKQDLLVGVPGWYRVRQLRRYMDGLQKEARRGGGREGA